MGPDDGAAWWPLTVGASGEHPQHSVALCATCGHPHLRHYATPEGGGCVATNAPIGSLEAALAGIPIAPLLAGDIGACLCPGWSQGTLPHAITKHLDGLTDDPDDLTGCPDCVHPLARHGAGWGCWHCSCERNELPG